MNMPKLVLVLLFFTISIMGCSTNPNNATHSSIPSPSETVTANVIFRAFSAVDQQPLPDVNIVVIDQDGNVVDKLATNDAGEVNQAITVPVDPKYQMDQMKRGTVTVIASKEGYRDAVILETPVSEGSAAQPFQMEPVVPEERNEPTVQLGKNHRLEIISMVDKYKDDDQVSVSKCSEPPKSFEWGNKTYNLKEIGNENLEPGMKLGYLDCNNGAYTQQSAGENATYNIYSLGNPLKSDDLLYFGIWGRALYTPAEKEDQAQLRSVEVSFYKSDSPRGQPELINMYTDKSAPEKLKEFASWIEQSKSSVSIDASDVKGIYFIQLDFNNRSSKHFLCVHADDEKVYLKPIQPDQVREVNLDKFDSNLIAHLIEIAGKEDWLVSTEIPQ